MLGRHGAAEEKRIQPDLFKLKCITRKRAGAFLKIKIVNGCRVHLSLFKYGSQPAQCLTCHLIGRIAAQELNAALHVEKIPSKTPVIVKRSSLFHFWKVVEEHAACSVEIWNNIPRITTERERSEIWIIRSALRNYMFMFIFFISFHPDLEWLIPWTAFFLWRMLA